MTPPDLEAPEQPAAGAPDPGRLEQAILAVLTGAPAHRTARQAAVTPVALAAAARAYQQAGRATLASITGAAGTWKQVIVEFSGWDTAEHAAATALAPRLQDPAVTAGWWFIRKYPHWRIRYRPATAAAPARERVGGILNELTDAGQIRGWRDGIYEPETLAFGGSAGMAIAHDLFCADSLGVLAVFGQALSAGASRPAGRKELSLLLCSALMRSAGLDWFERGDAWHRVTSLRPPALMATQSHHEAVKALLTADMTPASPMLAPGGPLASVAAWAEAFRQAGQFFGAAAAEGQLHRGLRDVLAHLIIFHWNRIGLTAASQTILARTARDVIMNTTIGIAGSH